MSAILSDHPQRRARKVHRCWYCDQLIPIGEVHGYRTGVTDGDFWQMRHHPECDAWAVANWDYGDWECHETGCDFERPKPTAPAIASGI